MTAKQHDLSLVADIGGTNTRVALARGARVDAGTIMRFRNAEHDGIAAVIHAYLGRQGIGHEAISGVCAAAAGPVRDGVAQLTNLHWRIDRDVLAEALSAGTAAVLNDLQAQGHAVGHIAPENLEEVLPQPDHPPHAAKLVVGIGTGFNACPVFETDGGRFVPPSEAGHVSLPVTIPGLAEMLPLLDEGDGFPGVEVVLSGRGVSTLHAALHGTRMPASDVLAGIASGDAAARETGRLFVTIMGQVIGDLALGHLPFGGIFLIGGVARAFGPWLGAFGFAEAFRDKGRFSGFMGSFGVQIVTDDYAALTGCASHLARL